MYCDETTNATNIPLAKIYLFTIEIDLQSGAKKNPPFWPPAAILNF
jgi:hypothetical protein